MDHRVIGERSDAVLRTAMPGGDELFGCRDAPSHPSFATPRKAKPKSVAKNSSLKRREAERREAHHRAASIKMRRTPSPVFPLREDRGRRRPQKMERARSPFGAPPRHPRFWASARLRPRFLEPPDANGRTLSGTSAASTSRSGTRRTGRCPSRPRAQCMAAPDENRSRSALRSTLAKGVPLRAGFSVGNRNGDESQEQCRFVGDGP